LCLTARRVGDIVAGAPCQSDLTQEGFDSFCGQFNTLLKGPEAQVIGNGSGKEKEGLRDHSNSAAQFRWGDLVVIASFKPHGTPGGLV
jgi:hypothetical protein